MKKKAEFLTKKVPKVLNQAHALFAQDQQKSHYQFDPQLTD